MRYIQSEDPVHMFEYSRILNIRSKKYHDPEIPYLSVNQIKEILDAPNVFTESGFRDKVMLTVLYDTGARVEELINMKYEDIRFNKPEVIKIKGKGDKRRTVPIMGSTVEL